MNIAYIVPSLANKGPVLVVKELVNQMTINGHQCSLFYFDDKQGVAFDCQTIKIKKNEKINFTIFDIVHSHGMRPDKYVSRYREHSGKVRYISTIHNYVLQDFRYEYNWVVAQIFGRLWMHSLRKFDKIVTLSQDAERYYQRWFYIDKITYAYNTRNVNTNHKLEQNIADELIKFKGNSILIGVNCLLTKRKGVDMLINAMCTLPALRLCVVGSGPELKRLKAQALKNKVTDRCLFMGYVTDAYRFLPYYDIYALPSRSEGFPLALLEAAVFAKQCIVSNLPIITECFTPNEVAFFELHKPYSIIPAIEFACLHHDMGQKLHSRYLNDYSPQKMYERYLDIYNGKI